MHASVIESNQHRDRERQRKAANIQKRKKQGLVRVFGLDPAFTPAQYPDGIRRDRRNKSRPERQMRRFFRSWIMLLNQ